jgi:hypothetical protein
MYRAMIAEMRRATWSGLEGRLVVHGQRDSKVSAAPRDREVGAAAAEPGEPDAAVPLLPPQRCPRQ